MLQYLCRDQIIMYTVNSPLLPNYYQLTRDLCNAFSNLSNGMVSSAIRRYVWLVWPQKPSWPISWRATTRRRQPRQQRRPERIRQQRRGCARTGLILACICNLSAYPLHAHWRNEERSHRVILVRSRREPTDAVLGHDQLCHVRVPEHGVFAWGSLRTLRN